MIISRTPYRISFFGGGTDYPGWYRQNGGSVLATTINKYCYLTCRYLPPFFEHRIRVVYSQIESCQSFEEIKHPSVRETLRFLNLHRGLEIHHDGDLPARSGMGSSSAFTVGLLHALYALEGVMPGKHRLATESIHIEQDMIRETVGSQDQVSAAYGGLNHIMFRPDGEIIVRPIIIRAERLRELNQHLMLFYTGIVRNASIVAKSYVEDLHKKRERLSAINSMVEKGIEILCSPRCVCYFGELLHEGWLAKRGLSEQVTNFEVDELYENARRVGAIGGKLIGAGGGGFLLLFVPPSARRKVRETLKNHIHVPFEFDHGGSQIIFYDRSQEDYSELERSLDRSVLRPFREATSLCE